MVPASGQWIAAVRARVSERADALFVDPFAAELAGDVGFRMMARSEEATGRESAYTPVRVRWFDDAVVAATSAGLDLNSASMHAYRDHCARHDLPPPFGSDDPVGLLRAGGWQPGDVVAAGAPGANHGRLPPAPEGVIAGATHLVVGQMTGPGRRSRSTSER